MPDTLRLLQVQASESEAASIVCLLAQSGYTVDASRVQDARALQDALSRQDWDVVVSDYCLPGFDATGALAILKASVHDLPFIVVSGTPGESIAVEIMRRGAHDYLMKDNLARLPSSIARELRFTQERRKKRDAAQELREAQERLTLALEATQLGIFDFYPQTGRLALSPSLKALYGIPPEAEASWKTFLRHVHPDERGPVRRIVSEALRPADRGMQCGRFAAEHRTIGHPDGQTRSIVTWGSVFFDAAGRPVRFLGAAKDVTERKRAAGKLQYQLELTQCITQQSADSIFVIDPEGLITFVNPEVERAFGFTAAELLGHSLHDMLHHHYPDGRPLPASDCLKVRIQRAGQTLRGHEDLFFGKDGTPIDISCSSAPLEVNGVCSGVVLTVRDITGRKRAELALRESEARFRCLKEADIVGIVIAGADRIVEANDHFIRMLGYTREEFAAGEFSWRAITAPEFREATHRQYLTAIDAGSCAAYEKKLLRKDGARVPVIVGGVAINHAGQRCLFAFTVDLTGRRNLEEQLRQAQKLDSVGRLAGGLAHDFNNLLTIVLGYSRMISSELAAGHPAGPEMPGRIAEISKAATRARALTRQLLAFSSQQPGEPKVVRIDRIVMDVEQMLRRLIGADIEIVLAPGAGTSFIHADVGQIEQVVMNLAVNARDAMPGGGTLCIETSPLFVDEQFAALCLSVPPGHYVQLVVSDTGSGMSPEVAARVFEPFFTTKEQGKGTGLGLSTVYGIVKQSGGSISVHSTPGLGATFRVLFPQVESGGLAEGAGPEEIVAAGTETILLVEDEAGVRQYAREVLSSHGYRVIEAGNCGEALKRAREHQGSIDLLLTDFVLPGGSGDEIARQVAQVRPGVPVLMMSGYANRIGRRPEKDAAFLQKPFLPADLLRVTRRILDSKPATSAA